MRTFRQFLRESSSPVPAPPGTVSLPAGRVRRFHVTQADPEVIAREGLRMAAAKGIEGPRGIYGWSTWKDAYAYAGGGQAPIVEYSITQQEADTHPVVVQRDIPPADIIAIHEPWHAQYRYAKENDVDVDTLRQIGTPEYTKAADQLERDGHTTS